MSYNALSYEFLKLMEVRARFAIEQARQTDRVKIFYNAKQHSIYIAIYFKDKNTSASMQYSLQESVFFSDNEILHLPDSVYNVLRSICITCADSIKQ